MPSVTDAGVGRLHDGVSGERRRNEHDAGFGTGLCHGVLHRVEHREPQVFATALARGNAADQVRAVTDHLLGVERAHTPCETLDDDRGLLVDDDAHD